MKMLTPDQFLRQIRNLPNKFDAEINRAKQEIGQYSVAHFKSSFDRLGFAGGGGKKWAKRDHNYPWPILDKTGALKNSINFRVFNSSDRIIVSTSSKYSQFHNDPDGSWYKNQYSTEHTIRRQFMGNSKPLEKWIQRRLQRALINTFK